jgi:hypothetical protein
VEVEVKESRFALWDYNGTIPQAAPALCWKMTKEDNEEFEQYWSIGNSKDWVPSEDGKTLIPVGSATSLKTNSNGMMLLKSVVDSGFPEDKLGEDVSIFAGMICHVVRVPAPKRSGLEKRERADGKEYEQTVLVVDRIDKFPWEKPKATGASKAAGATGVAKAAKQATATAKAGTSAPAEDVLALATETVLEILVEAGGSVAKTTLPTATFRKLMGNSLQQKVVALVSKPDFLGNIEGTTFADGTLSFG